MPTTSMPSPNYVVASEPVDTTACGPAVIIGRDELIGAVTDLKSQDDKNILIWGAGQLTDVLSAAGLLDEYQISIVPVIKGDGESLFRQASAATLELTDSKTFGIGAVLLTYRPVHQN
ncbi:dihydrofolate reductase family protein [Nocardia sp. NPDC058114]|uniref:dihydrofolate reductase family protein n=1 Tax=Nocardia sp. NPDC058114 TaxID=3346346 RepID=UPI0036D8F4DE